MNTSFFDIIALSETWLSPSISNSELNFNNYIIYRCDRSPHNSVYSRGGGVLIAINCQLNSKILNVNINCVEHVFVQLNLGSNMFILSCAYIPPNSPITLYENYFSALNELCLSYPNSNLITLGDFNLPSLDWSLYSLPLNCNTQIVSYFVSMLSYLNLYQFNLVRNHNNVILDLALSNIHITVSNDSDPLLPTDKHHPALNFSLNCSQFNILPTHNLIKDFINCDYRKIIKYIGDSLSVIKFNTCNVNEYIDQFYSILYDVINNFVSQKQIYNNLYPIWFSNELKKLLKEKKIAHITYKKYNNISEYLHFSLLRSKCKQLTKSDYKNYITKTQSSIKQNPKYFWKFINNRKNKNALPSLLTLDSTVVDNGNDIVNLFAKYFFEAFSNTQQPLNYPPINIDNIDSKNTNSTLHINSLTLTELDVLNMISTLNKNSSIGPDGISIIFIYNCRFILTPILTRIFNTSLEKGIFPTRWKTSFISPIFKNGDPSLISNYRPIYKISIIPKLFSKLISSKLSKYCSSFLTNNQYGFIPKRSACNNLSVVKNIILHSFELNAQTDIIYTDFTKEFDQVNHLILFEKLKSFGFSGSLLLWFQ